jgi:hypothetical protein
MPTVEECFKAGRLIPLKGNLGARDVAHRLLVARPEVVEWMRQHLPGMQTDGFFPGSVEPRMQALLLFRAFVSGKPFDPPLPHEMEKRGFGVWRLRTVDLRFDGWFPRRCFFVIASVETKLNTKVPGRNDEIYHSVIQFREELGLFNGVYENSGDFNELVRI